MSTETTPVGQRLINILFDRESYLAHIEAAPEAVRDYVKPIVTSPEFLERFEAKAGKLILESLTEEECAALVDFYDTEIGQSLLRKMPALSGQISQTVQDAIDEMVQASNCHPDAPIRSHAYGIYGVEQSGSDFHVINRLSGNFVALEIGAPAMDQAQAESMAAHLNSFPPFRVVEDEMHGITPMCDTQRRYRITTRQDDLFMCRDLDRAEADRLCRLFNQHQPVNQRYLDLTGQSGDVTLPWQVSHELAKDADRNSLDQMRFLVKNTITGEVNMGDLPDHASLARVNEHMRQLNLEHFETHVAPAA